MRAALWCRFISVRGPRPQLVKEAQALHVRSEMAALATEAKALMDVDPWLAPEPPQPPGGTRLPHLFGALAHQRMLDLVRHMEALKKKAIIDWAALWSITADRLASYRHFSRHRYSHESVANKNDVYSIASLVCIIVYNSSIT